MPESITLASRVFCLLILLFIILRFYTSWLGLRWPSSWARLAQVSATRLRYRCHPFGTLLRWGIRFLSGVRIRCFDYSRVIRVRVLLTFYPPSLRSLRILASLRVTCCAPPACLPSHLLTCGPFIRFVGFFPVSQGYSCVGVVRHDDYSADSSTSLAQCSFVGGFLPNFAIFALVSVHLGNFGLSSLACIGIPMPFFANSACLFSSISLL